MGKTLYELDANGDILLSVYNVSYDLPQDWRELDGDMLAGFSEPRKKSPEPVGNPADGETAEDNENLETHDQSILQIRASSKHLMLSCPQFERTLQQGFREGNELQSTGCLELPIEDWEAMPFLILMMIIHGRTRAVPRKISLKRLSEMAVLVDYYECYEAVEVFSGMWIDALEQGRRLSLSSIIDAQRWLFISWVFQRNAIFQSSSRYLQREDEDKLLTKDFPIPNHVQGAIDQSRETAIKTIIQYLHDTITNLQGGKIICRFPCDCIMLGALTKHMLRMRLFSPELKSNYHGLSFAKLKLDLCEMKYPESYNAYSVGTHDCRLSFQSKLYYLLDSTDKSLQGLDIQSFTKPQNP